jgi:hypothetical protein
MDSTVDTDTDFQLDNTIYIIRTVALFLVSLIYVLAPLPSDAESAEGVARTLESTLYTQRLTALARQVNNPPVPHRRG